MNGQTRSDLRRILVVTLADLGDALLAVPALTALRHAQPHAHIDVLTTPLAAKVLERTAPAESNRSTDSIAARTASHCFNDLIVFEKHRFDRPGALLHPHNLAYSLQLWRQIHREPYDACLILHHLTTWFGTLKYAALAAASGAGRRYGLDNGRGWFLTDRIPDRGFGVHHQAMYWQQIAELLGAEPKRHSSAFTFTDDEAHRADVMLSTNHGHPRIALHPGSGAYAPARRWPPYRWAALADKLIADDAAVVLLGGTEETDLRRSMLGAMRHRERVIDLGGRTTLGELAAVLQRCDLFVGNDSGVAHLAGSVGTPVVAVFGPTDPRAWGPYVGRSWEAEQDMPNGVTLFRSGQHRALKASIACSPCIYRGLELGTPNGCPDRTCLLRVDVEQVLALVRERLRETRLTSTESDRYVRKGSEGAA